MSIPRPTPRLIEKYLNRWDRLDKYVFQEQSLNKLFIKTYPKNLKMEDVLIKVCSLNDFYSTNIFEPLHVARHIVDLRIDGALRRRSPQIVNDIAKVRISSRQSKYFYSFATKYCSHHLPEDYPIYDSFVDKMLRHFGRKDAFAKFSKADLKDYPSYKEILTQFRFFYGLDDFSLKEIDKYLWQEGKKRFPKTYY